MQISFSPALILLASVLAVFVQLGHGQEMPPGAIKECVNKNIALTLDDGPTAFTKSVVKQLVAARQYATFFVNVNNYGE
jgi:peptidoglycan/xylan/chitin deacetylase (PgdA/CDA1 family)